MTSEPDSVKRAIGIDLAAGRGTTEVVRLSLASLEGTPFFHASDHRPVVSDEDIVAGVVSYRPDVVAIDAPLSLPARVAHSLAVLGPCGGEHAATLAFSPPDSVGIAAAETIGASPYSRAAERDHIWSRLGVRPFPVSFLGGLTFRAITLLPALRLALPESRIIEVFPSGSASALGLRMDSDTMTSRSRRLAKTAPQIRARLQSALAEHITGIPNVDENGGHPLSADLLDALLAALTAVAYLRGSYVAIGDPAEGQIVLPQS